MAWHYLIPIAIGVYLAIEGGVGIVRGGVRAPDRSIVYRRKQPVTYWILVLLWLGAAVAVFWVM